MSATAKYTPIERNSVAEQVAKRLLELVRTKNLKPGEMLPTERDLAAMLQVSRPSVREAVRGLQILGVLKSRQGSGIYVSSLDAADMLGPWQFLITLNTENVDALYEARLLIDGGIAGMASTRITESNVERLEHLIAVQRGLTSDPLGFRVSDLEFHRTIMEATGNPFLVHMASSLYVLGMEYRRMASESPGVLKQSLTDHKAIVAGLKKRDPDETARAAEQHIRNVHKSTIDAMDPDK